MAAQLCFFLRQHARVWPRSNKCKNINDNALKSNKESLVQAKATFCDFRQDSEVWCEQDYYLNEIKN